ncbi:hypothetical protein LCGC14_1542200 [marine sediment metagenome]|uniref:Roadblock/LAMTOR2 domain-containing protein n=1 Tax=marine sediment metagenome TaxID=412755 RepID=A0A0F9L8T3_9ZZZZ
MKQIKYEEIIAQLKSDLNAECAIANKYGIILGSIIKEFAKGNVIPQGILSLISNFKEIANELNLEKINFFALEAQEYHYLFTFSRELILISKLNLDVNLAKFKPNVSVFLKRLSKSIKDEEIKEFSIFNFSKEISKMEETLE